MTCQECEPLNGPLADGELQGAHNDLLLAHLAGCPACTAKLSAIRELGETVRMMPVQSPPAELWDGIAAQLAASPIAAPIAGKLHARRPVPWLRVAAVAALLLIAVYTGWLAYGPTPGSREHSEVPVVDLGPILDKGVPVNFIGAADFNFVAAPLDQAKQQVAFHVFAQPKLGEGYTAEECKVGCCGPHSIVQTQYRGGKNTCVMLQYPRGLPVSFGAAPVERMNVGDKTISLVQGKKCWAASWHSNGTGVTIIGPDDREELLRLVAKVEKSFEGATP